MENILEALIPIFLLILLGYGFKRIKFPDDAFWPYADKFTYYVLFPSLLVYKLSTANLSDIDGFAYVSSALIALVIVSLALMLFNKMALFEGKAFTSIFQGATRFNTYVFLALVDALFGDGGLVLAAFLITFLIPIINILCISIFSLYAASSKITVMSFTKSIVKNPLIVACVLGGAINFFGVNLTTPVLKTLSVLSSAALPLGLLSVGVGLHLSHIKEAKMELLTSMFFKLAIFPAVIFFVAKAMGVEGLALSVLVVFGAMPTASSAYILARELGGDLKLMSSIVTLETIVSIVTLSVLLQVIAS